MDTKKFIAAMKEYGDAYVTYVSPISKKEKFHVGTMDYQDNPYIATKPAITDPDPTKVIMFCWDTDSFRQIDPATVIRVESLSAELEKARGRNDRRNNERGRVKV